MIPSSLRRLRSDFWTQGCGCREESAYQVLPRSPEKPVLRKSGHPVGTSHSPVTFSTPIPRVRRPASDATTMGHSRTGTAVRPEEVKTPGSGYNCHRCLLILPDLPVRAIQYPQVPCSNQGLATRPLQRAADCGPVFASRSENGCEMSI